MTTVQITDVEFDYAICEEITSETGWLVKSFQCNIIQTKM